MLSAVIAAALCCAAPLAAFPQELGAAGWTATMANGIGAVLAGGHSGGRRSVAERSVKAPDPRALPNRSSTPVEWVAPGEGHLIVDLVGLEAKIFAIPVDPTARHALDIVFDRPAGDDGCPRGRGIWAHLDTVVPEPRPFVYDPDNVTITRPFSFLRELWYAIVAVARTSELCEGLSELQMTVKDTSIDGTAVYFVLAQTREAEVAHHVTPRHHGDLPPDPRSSAVCRFRLYYQVRSAASTARVVYGTAGLSTLLALLWVAWMMRTVIALAQSSDLTLSSPHLWIDVALLPPRLAVTVISALGRRLWRCVLRRGRRPGAPVALPVGDPSRSSRALLGDSFAGVGAPAASDDHSKPVGSPASPAAADERSEELPATATVVGAVADDDEDDEPLCRICKEPSAPGYPLVTPCACQGSVRFIHRACLDQWRVQTTNSRFASHCEICHAEFRTPPVPAASLAAAWLLSGMRLVAVVGGLAVVVLVCGVITRLLLGPLSCSAPYHSLSVNVFTARGFAFAALTYIWGCIAIHASVWLEWHRVGRPAVAEDHVSIVDAIAAASADSSGAEVPGLLAPLRRSFYLRPSTVASVVVHTIGSFFLVSALGAWAKAAFYYTTNIFAWNNELQLGAGSALAALFFMVVAVVAVAVVGLSRRSDRPNEEPLAAAEAQAPGADGELVEGTVVALPAADAPATLPVGMSSSTPANQTRRASPPPLPVPQTTSPPADQFHATFAGDQELTEISSPDPPAAATVGAQPTSS